MSRTAEEWGRIAVSLPGWRWMPGMRYTYGGFSASTGASEDYVERLWEDDAGPYDHAIFPTPDPDDPATEGCLIRLLGPVHEAVWYTGDCDRWVVAVGEERRLYTSLGRACIAAAEAIGRWPGGEA